MWVCGGVCVCVGGGVGGVRVEVHVFLPRADLGNAGDAEGAAGFCIEDLFIEIVFVCMCVFLCICMCVCVSTSLKIYIPWGHRTLAPAKQLHQLWHGRLGLLPLYIC